MIFVSPTDSIDIGMRNGLLLVVDVGEVYCKQHLPKSICLRSKTKPGDPIMYRLQPQMNTLASFNEDTVILLWTSRGVGYGELCSNALFDTVLTSTQLLGHQGLPAG